MRGHGERSPGGSGPARPRLTFGLSSTPARPHHAKKPERGSALLPAAACGWKKTRGEARGAGGCRGAATGALSPGPGSALLSPPAALGHRPRRTRVGAPERRDSRDPRCRSVPPVPCASWEPTPWCCEHVVTYHVVTAGLFRVRGKLRPPAGCADGGRGGTERARGRGERGGRARPAAASLRGL